ncbi:hypothetical protein [Flagellimonas pacifica]|uniref:Uncharacterized protein n=1 Tax=Flagellimonas pacifica TaxID=1247520 RepID=A0A285MQY8_9FLAO|nr:hypothetical protein [Allomuricauda parva]SNY99558.1 hypothetical protein SAMN06265377_1369 [Allomuricauda parva]
MAEENNPENEENSSNKELVEVLKEFLKDTNLEKIITSYNQGKKEEWEAKKTFSTDNLSFWHKRFFKDSFIVFLILFAIVLLAWVDKISESTLGTLLGSVIGYAIGNSRRFKEKD